MNKRLKIAFCIYLLLVLVLVVMGILYLATPTIMPYHQQATGVSWGDIVPGAQALMWLFVKVIGLFFLITALAVAMLTVFPFRKGETWAIISMVVLSVCTSMTTLWAALYVQLKTGARTPWPICAVSLLLAVVAAGLSTSTIKPGRAK